LKKIKIFYEPLGNIFKVFLINAMTIVHDLNAVAIEVNSDSNTGSASIYSIADLRISIFCNAYICF